MKLAPYNHPARKLGRMIAHRRKKQNKTQREFWVNLDINPSVGSDLELGINSYTYLTDTFICSRVFSIFKDNKSHNIAIKLIDDIEHSCTDLLFKDIFTREELTPLLVRNPDVRNAILNHLYA